MLGHDHALSGALAFAVVAPLLPVSGTQLAVAAALGVPYVHLVPNRRLQARRSSGCPRYG